MIICERLHERTGSCVAAVSCRARRRLDEGIAGWTRPSYMRRMQECSAVGQLVGVCFATESANQQTALSKLPKEKQKANETAPKRDLILPRGRCRRCCCSAVSHNSLVCPQCLTGQDSLAESIVPCRSRPRLAVVAPPRLLMLSARVRLTGMSRR